MGLLYLLLFLCVVVFIVMDGEFVFKKVCILFNEILMLVNKWSVFFIEIEIENFIMFKVDNKVKIWNVVRKLFVRSRVVMEMNFVMGVLVK